NNISLLMEVNGGDGGIRTLDTPRERITAWQFGCGYPVWLCSVPPSPQTQRISGRRGAALSRLVGPCSRGVGSRSVAAESVRHRNMSRWANRVVLDRS